MCQTELSHVTQCLQAITTLSFTILTKAYGVLTMRQALF